MQRSWTLPGVNKHSQEDRNPEATIYVGNLDDRATDALLWELFLQVGPVQVVHIPKDRVTQTHQGYGFVEFLSEDDADYATKIMNQVKLFGKPLRVNKASSDKKGHVEIGAELFIGNLDQMVDEKILYDTFSAFGPFASAPTIARDENGVSKGYGFVSYTSFAASDAAIESMNQQFLMNKSVNVQYAFKKDNKGERHGTKEERQLEMEARKRGVQPIGLPPLPAGFTVKPPVLGSGGVPVAPPPSSLSSHMPPPPPDFPPGAYFPPQSAPALPPGFPPGAPPPPAGFAAQPAPLAPGFAPPPPPPPPRPGFWTPQGPPYSGQAIPPPPAPTYH